MEYAADIGLEVHAELSTRSKLFCGCSTEFGAGPNTHTCPVCLGMPGVLPVMNRRAFEYVVRTALAANCEVPSFVNFDRKNYYYPDLPKNYQISQTYHNIGADGWIEIAVNGDRQRIGILNVHLEEDAGKLVHTEGTDYSLVDLNRAGVPLIEIVTAPDMHSAEEAEAFMKTARNLLMYLGVSDCRMEQGHLRFEASISVREAGAGELGGMGHVIGFELGWTSLIAYSFMLFTLIYVPCMAALAIIRRETNSWRWPLFTAGFTTGLAWVIAVLVYQIGRLFT